MLRMKHGPLSVLSKKRKFTARKPNSKKLESVWKVSVLPQIPTKNLI